MRDRKVVHGVARGCAFVGVLLLLAAAAPAQDTQPPKGEKQDPYSKYYVNQSTAEWTADSQTKGDKKKAKGIDEDGIEKALRQNPEILVRQAKLSEAEAVLNQVKHEVMAKILKTAEESIATKKILVEIQNQLTQLLALPKSAVTEREMSETRATITKYQSMVINLKGEVQSLAGIKAGQAAADMTLDALLAAAQKQNADILLAEARLRVAEAELQQAKQFITGQIAKTQIEIEQLRNITTEVQSQLKILLQLQERAKNAVTSREVFEARAAVARYEGELAVKQQHLQSLIGKTSKLPAGTDSWVMMTYTVSDEVVEPLTKLLQSILEHHKIAWNVKGGLKKGSRQFEVMAPVSVHGEIVKFSNDPQANWRIFSIEAMATPSGKKEGAKSADDAPPILKTYVVPPGQAEELAKLLQDMYKASPTLRLTAGGGTQLISYAPAAIQSEIAKHIQVAAAVARAKGKPFKADDGRIVALIPIQGYEQQWAEKFGEQVREKLAELGVKVDLRRDNFDDRSYMVVIQFEPASFQKIEDILNIRFAIGDNGIYGVEANRVPPDALLLRDFIKQGPAKDSKDKK